MNTLNKSILNRLVNKILVSEDGNLEIEYYFSNPFK